jgi:hypothetical protein
VQRQRFICDKLYVKLQYFEASGHIESLPWRLAMAVVPVPQATAAALMGLKELSQSLGWQDTMNCKQQTAPQQNHLSIDW